MLGPLGCVVCPRHLQVCLRRCVNTSHRSPALAGPLELHGLVPLQLGATVCHRLQAATRQPLFSTLPPAAIHTQCASQAPC